MVMRSSARTIIRCQAQLQPDEVDERCHKPEQRHDGHDSNVSEGISIEFEARRLRKEHGSDQGALGRVETSADDHGQGDGLFVPVLLRTPSAG